jgi:hypothetical protein
LAKHTSTPAVHAVLTRLSAPFILFTDPARFFPLT